MFGTDLKKLKIRSGWQEGPLKVEDKARWVGGTHDS